MAAITSELNAAAKATPTLCQISEGNQIIDLCDEAEEQDDAFPADKGIAAWRFLIGAFVIEALLWGFLLTFGVFQEYYSAHSPLTGDKNIPWIGVLGTGTLFLGSPLMTYLSRRYHQWQKFFMFGGWIICVVALLSASFCSSLGSLAVTQGFLYGFGFLVLYYPVLSMLDEWFIQRRGLAYGILFGAAGISGIVLPFIVEILLSTYGYQTALRAFAATIFLLSGPAILMLRRRCSKLGGPARSLKIGSRPFFRQSHFYLLALSNMCQGFAFYLPLIYLPSYATDLGYSSARGALLLALANAAQVIGQVTYGQLSDKMDVHILLFISSGVSAVAASTLWGLAKSFPPLILFALLYGGFAGGFVVLWPRMGMLLSEADAQTIYGILAFEKGIGNVLSGPISSALIRQPAERHLYAIGKYQGIVIFVSICMALSAVLGVAGRFASRLSRASA